MFFSKQKDKFIVKLGDFFERHQRRMYGDRTFYMLYDMIIEKVDEYIFLPFLTSLFEKCDRVEEVEDEKSGYVCRFVVSEVRQQSEDFAELLDELNSDEFILKKQYYAVHQYMKELSAKQKTEDDNLLDLL